MPKSMQSRQGWCMKAKVNVLAKLHPYIFFTQQFTHPSEKALNKQGGAHCTSCPTKFRSTTHEHKKVSTSANSWSTSSARKFLSQAQTCSVQSNYSQTDENGLGHGTRRDCQDKWDGYQQMGSHLEGEDMTLLLGRIEALERALRVGHSSATHDTPSVTNFGHGTRRMKNPDPDLSTTGATGTTHLPTAWQDLTALDSLVHFYFREGLATSTQKTYEARRKKFNQFCIAFNIFNSLLVNQQTLCYFVTYLAKHNLFPATIEVYLSALWHYHIASDVPELDRVKNAKIKDCKQWNYTHISPQNKGDTHNQSKKHFNNTFQSLQIYWDGSADHGSQVAMSTRQYSCGLWECFASLDFSGWKNSQFLMTWRMTIHCTCPQET